MIFLINKSRTMSSSGSSDSIDGNSLPTQINNFDRRTFQNRKVLFPHKRILPAQMVNWELTRDSGILEHLENWLVQGGNENRSCSLREFGYRLRLYRQAESEENGFEQFHMRANYAPDDTFSYADFCATISSTRYHENTISESHMHLLSHRMLHRLISTMLWPRTDADRVLPRELHLMCALMRKLQTCNIPYFIADYFKQITDAPLKFVAIGGIHFVMHLALSYGLLTPHNVRVLEVIPPIIFSPPTTTSRDIIYIDDGATSVLRSPFLALRCEPSTSQKRPRETVSLPQRIAPATLDSRFIADEVKSIHRTLHNQELEHNILSATVRDIDRRTQNTQTQLMWLSECVVKFLADSKCTIPRPRPPLIEEEEEEPMEEEPEEEEEYDTAHN
ncbi:hypothetical protein L2E82_45411 [Cichorium intybus]|uniref:Uncharacterized protein n=1 Tax=Cichorium intybus TaxID=13427 RepID=A0ACB8ZU95_CICIN|nr:hypothetical protein L2E82_45411 [Cichorium intybus]